MTPCPFGTSARERRPFWRSWRRLLILVFLSPSIPYRSLYTRAEAVYGAQLGAFLSIVVVLAVSLWLYTASGRFPDLLDRKWRSSLSSFWLC